jgi:hypothetical protein
MKRRKEGKEEKRKRKRERPLYFQKKLKRNLTKLLGFL